jgi:prepilin-type processing-associated H-X9-DG protein
MYLNDSNELFNPTYVHAPGYNDTSTVWNRTNLTAAGTLIGYVNNSAKVYYCPDGQWEPNWGSKADAQARLKSRPSNYGVGCDYPMGIIPIMVANYGITSDTGIQTTKLQAGLWRKNAALLADIYTIDSRGVQKRCHQMLGFNVAYLDGHVSWYSSDPLKASGFFSSYDCNVRPFSGNLQNKNFWESVSGYPAYSQGRP